MKPLRGGDALAAAHLANALALANDGFAGGEAAVAVGVGGINGLAIELGEQDMRDGAEDRLGRAFEDVRKMDLEASVAQPDGGVEAGEASEVRINGRHGRARAQRPVLFLEELDEVH